MSDFCLTQIAPYLEKDERTLRRWCELGHVPGAYRRPGKRGHWRIRGESVQLVVAAITAAVGAAPIKTRRRRENAYPPHDFFSRGQCWQTPAQAWDKLSDDERAALSRPGHVRWRWWPERGVFNLSDQRDRARLLVQVIGELRAHVESQNETRQRAALSRLDLEWIARNATPSDYEAVLTELSSVLGRRAGGRRMGPSSLSDDMDISRSTFYRWFPGWRMAVYGTLQKDREKVKIGRDDDGANRGAPIYELVQLADESADDNYNAAG
jgi:hypothetical protein